jgi:aldose 1-epimerase
MSDEQLLFGFGYDHNWVLNKKQDDSFILAAKLWEETSGRVMEIYTTEPGIQFYSGNFMNGTVKGKTGKIYMYRAGLALETQHFPDSPNHDNFPTTVLNPGEKYKQLVALKFKVMD